MVELGQAGLRPPVPNRAQQPVATERKAPPGLPQVVVRVDQPGAQRSRPSTRTAFPRSTFSTTAGGISKDRNSRSQRSGWIKG